MPSNLADIHGIHLPWHRSGSAPLRRDMHLIRELLLEIEASGTQRDFSAWTDEDIRAHLRLMIHGGLLTGEADGSRVTIHHITWAGHDYLGAIRPDATWRRVLAKITEAGGGLAFDAIKQLALSTLP